MIAARNDQSIQVALLARHSVERFDRAHHREKRQQVVVGQNE